MYVGDRDVPCVSLLHKIPCYPVSSVLVPGGKSVKIPVTWSTASLVCCTSCETSEPSSLGLFECSYSDSCIYAGVVSVAVGRADLLCTNSGVDPLVVKSDVVVGTVSSMLDSCYVFSDNPDILTSLVEPGSSDPECESEPVELGDHLSSSEKQRIGALLDSYPSVFSRSDDDVGRFDVTEHRIELYDYTPIYQKPRRFPEVVNQEIESQCRELELLDIIEPSQSPWSSPVVPIRKKDGSLRLCIDYRRLNDVTKPDKFPLPNLNDSIFGLCGMQYFTCMDLVRGYYQLPLEESSREFTAFSTPRAHWQFKRLAFGLKNAPSGFQRQMQHILSCFPWRKVIVYLDDLLIMGSTFEEHFELVGKVLRVLGEHGVKIRRDKCHWFEKQVQFLGHIVSREGLSKPPAYMEQVDSFPKPQTVKELRSFLGLVNFQRKFVPNCSVIMKPLSRLTGGKSSSKLVWNDAMNDAFQMLKDELKKELTLSFPDYSDAASPLELYTDASALGVGACLVQQQNGLPCRIAFASMAFNSAQRNYSTLERELAAVRWAVKAFRPFVYGVNFVIHTDHQPLVYLSNMKIVNSRLARTLEDLADYSFVIRYTPGQANTAADAFSRIHELPKSSEVILSAESLPDGIVSLTKVDGGGDSMIQSLVRAVKHASLSVVVPDALELRVVLVDELSRSPSNYFPKHRKTLSSELRLMKLPGQLLPVETLVAFSALYSCVVLVHFGSDFPIVYVDPSVQRLAGLPRVHLQCLQGVHYNPLCELSSYVPPPLMVDEASKKDENESVLSGEEPGGESVLSGEEPSVPEECAVPEVVFAPLAAAPRCDVHHQTHSASVTVFSDSLVFCALVDSGAQVSCVSRDVLSWCNHEHVSDSVPSIKGLGSKRSSTLGCSRMHIRIGDGASFSYTFIVVDPLTMPFCFLLGADCLSEQDIKLDFSTMSCVQGDELVKMNSAASTLTPSSFVLDCCRVGYVREIHVGPPDRCLAFQLDYDSSGDLAGLTQLIEYSQLLTMQRRDRQLMSLKRCLSRPFRQWPRALNNFKRYLKSIRVSDGLLVFCQPSGKDVGIVSFSFLVEMSLALHYKMAHLGRQKLWAWLVTMFGILVCPRLHLMLRVLVLLVRRVRFLPRFSLLLPRSSLAHLLSWYPLISLPCLSLVEDMLDVWLLLTTTANG